MPGADLGLRCFIKTGSHHLSHVWGEGREDEERARELLPKPFKHVRRGVNWTHMLSVSFILNPSKRWSGHSSLIFQSVFGILGASEALGQDVNLVGIRGQVASTGGDPHSWLLGRRGPTHWA